MDTKRNWKAWVTVAVVVLAVLQLLPTFVSGLPSAYTDIFDKKLNFGLDLKGGLELRYTVDYKKAIGDNTFRLQDSLRERLIDAFAKKQGKDPATLAPDERKQIEDKFTITRTAFNAIRVQFKDPADVALLDTELAEGLDPKFELRKADATATLFMPDKAVNELKEEIVDQTLTTIRKRVDAFGLVEPDVRRSGDADIDLQLPGLSDRQMAMVRERIGQAAQLTFRMVRPEARVLDDKQAALDQFKAANPEQAKTVTLVPDANGAFLRAQHKSELIRFVRTVQVPDDVLVGYEFIEVKDPLSGQLQESYWRTWNLEGRTELTGDNLTRAAVGYGERGEPVVNLEFDSRGARIFGDLTEKNVGNLMAIMLDEDVTSAPQIKEPIRGGRAQITLGRGSSMQRQMEEARSLVTVLNNGAYKAPVIKVHDIEVGPSLGRDAVRSGLVAMAAGILLVLGFMVVYYKQGGLIADVALVVNLTLQLALLVSVNAALTLPGMAALALTMAMAVDANILIFERMREEARLGRSVRNALEQGYGRAFWTIFDAQITTALAAVILMLYSSGPIYGFAVTLVIGVVTSMFTSIVVTRLMYDWLLARGKLEELSI